MSDPSKPVEGAGGTSRYGELFPFLERLRTVILGVAGGDRAERLDSHYPDDHPIGALTTSLNAMIEALDESRRTSEASSRELADQIDTIERQDAAIRELSTPIIEVWPGVLCAPIIGVLDSSRATEMTRTLLATVVEKKTPLVIIDVTGIKTMDARASDNFVRMARSVRLLGAKCVVSGVHPNIARTIVQLGVDLHGIESYRSTREALARVIAASRKTESSSQAKE